MKPVSPFHYCDYSLSEVPCEVRQRLQRRDVANLFCTLSFGESYCNPPGERVCFLQNDDGEIIDHCVYRESSWAPFFRQIEILGPVDLYGHLLGELQRRTRANKITAQLMSAQELPPDIETRRGIVFRRTAEDLCIVLPESSFQYLQRLGSSTRKHLPYYLRRLRKEWGEAWSIEALATQTIPKTTFNHLLRLQQLRSTQKGLQSLWTEALREQRWRLVQEKGLLCCLYLRGKLVGGTLSFLHADEAYLIAIAHDPQFDRLNLGNISLWLTIEHLIRCRTKQFHLMWGKSFYKQQFGGVLRPLYKVEFFASPWLAAVWRAAGALRIPSAWNLLSRLGRRIRLQVRARLAKPLSFPSSGRRASQGGG